VKLAIFISLLVTAFVAVLAFTPGARQYWALIVVALGYMTAAVLGFTNART
jgi:hypothetical protein